MYNREDGRDVYKRQESATVINAVEAHHGDVEPQTLIACVVQAADTISAARPGARRETLETYTNRLKQLEEIANQFKGVDKSFAIQAGREIRVMVVPDQVTDDDMAVSYTHLVASIREINLPPRTNQKTSIIKDIGYLIKNKPYMLMITYTFFLFLGYLGMLSLIHISI